MYLDYIFKCEFGDLERSLSTGDDLEIAFKGPRHVLSLLGRQPHGHELEAQLGDGLRIAHDSSSTRTPAIGL
jgi:hypothetical protein